MSVSNIIRTNFNMVEANLLLEYINKGGVKLLQETCNELGEDIGINLIEDGIMGILTVVAIHSIGVNKIISATVVKPQSFSKQKEKLLAFLYKYEGNTVHYLSKEKGPTSPYGVYSYVNPDANVTIEMLRLYRKYGYSPKRRKDAKKLDNCITDNERKVLVDLAWEFYRDKYLGPKSIQTILLNSPMASLAFFSNSVNGGISKGNKLLQKSLRVKADGQLGKKSATALIDFLNNNSDNKLAQLQLGHMASFYRYLIVNNAKKFRQFAKGWCNRIKGAGYKTTVNKC